MVIGLYNLQYRSNTWPVITARVPATGDDSENYLSVAAFLE